MLMMRSGLQGVFTPGPRGRWHSGRVARCRAQNYLLLPMEPGQVGPQNIGRNALGELDQKVYIVQIIKLDQSSLDAGVQCPPLCMILQESLCDYMPRFHTLHSGAMIFVESKMAEPYQNSKKICI
jgi:hypothetical protein